MHPAEVEELDNDTIEILGLSERNHNIELLRMMKSTCRRYQSYHQIVGSLYITVIKSLNNVETSNLPF